MADIVEFVSARSYLGFAHSVTREARFVHDSEVREFLRIVLETSTSRRKSVRRDTIFFRAQRGFIWRTERAGEYDEFEVEAAFPQERMIPKAEYVGEGRANPSGIPCLYMATKRNTAMAEVRPWVGSRISVARFKVKRDCFVVDCSLDEKRSWEFEIVDLEIGAKLVEPKAPDREAGVWGDIAYAFSEPVALDEPHPNYVPTQVLAEAFRSHGYDGIIYKSLLDKEGKNVALFDIDAAELISCQLFETKSLCFEFAPADQPYFISKRYPEIRRSVANGEG